MTDLTDINPSEVLTRIETSDLSLWSDQRKDEFCNTFADRITVARHLLVTTAEKVATAAERRHFISGKHHRAIFKDLGVMEDRRYHNLGQQFQQFHPASEYHRGEYTVGGRTLASLELIAKTRSKDILDNLPALSAVVKVIDADTARKIDRKDRLEAEGEKLREQLDEICGVIQMSEVDQNMTVGAFRAMVSDREANRVRTIERMNTISGEARKLEEEIARALYAGLPGLSEAIIEVVREHIEQSIALEATGRRVAEYVKFGDSDAAVELLRHFEKDEVTVSAKVADRFRDALEKLKVAKGRKKKAAELRA